MIKTGDTMIEFTDMAGFEEVPMPNHINDVALDSKIYDNGVDEKDLTVEDEPISQEELEELILTNPQEYERLQIGGDISA